MQPNTEINLSKSKMTGVSKLNNEFLTFCPQSREEWRRWLEKNHRTCFGVWLIYYKVKSGKPSVQYSEAVKEALCFGWIDSKVKSLDEERYMQIITPRKPKSVWSKLNKQYIEELIEQGLSSKHPQRFRCTMIIVSNTSPIKYLILIGYINLLPELFQQIIIPQAVYRELSDASAPPPVQAWIAIPPTWLKIQAVS